MGERHRGDGLPGRRRAHPGGTVSTPEHADQAPGSAGSAEAAGSFDAACSSGISGSPGFSRFEARFGAALRADGVIPVLDPEAERRAVAAFRAARDSGAHRARTRPRDDWRPRESRRARLSLKGTLSVALAGLTLGGVAFAAIGSAGSGAANGRDTHRQARPSVSAARPAREPDPGYAAPGSGGAASTGAGSAAPAPRPEHPGTAQDTLAHCRTFTRAGDRGNALESTAWRRLVTAAGGTDRVAAYCAAQVARAAEEARSRGRAADAPQGQKTDKADKNDQAGKAGESGGSPQSGNGGSSGDSGNSGKGEDSGKSGVPRPGDAEADRKK